MESKGAPNNVLFTYITATRPRDCFCRHSNHCHMLLKFALSISLFHFLSYSWILLLHPYQPHLLCSGPYCFTPIPITQPVSPCLAARGDTRDTVQA